MRHNRDGRKLNRTASHRKAMLRNMVTSLFARERINTTTAKAKEARRLAERMITFARRGDLSARRHVAKTVQDPDVLKKLFSEIAPRFADRPGGYTRVLKTGVRRGDNAQTAILELLGEKEEGRKKKKIPRKKYHKVEIPESRAARKRAREEAEVVAVPESSGEFEHPGEDGAAVETEVAGAAEDEPTKKKVKEKEAAEKESENTSTADELESIEESGPDEQESGKDK
ncbi:MAG: 50S ribosomal protein L17 [bacterium]|nr:MAG: 50S ribosomal protein L17 [bacterium]